MKLINQIILIVLILFISVGISLAQENQFTKKYKEQAIKTLAKLMNDYYVYPQVAKMTEDHLLKQIEDGHFDDFKDDKSFADALTESVQSINHDKHMRIWKNKPYDAPENTPERKIEERLDRLNRFRTFNAGLNSVKLLEGNVGYVDLRGFAGMGSGKEIADAYMKLVSKSDAVIIDLSKNGGGSPDMVQYLCSYFFSEKLHLNSLYWREQDTTQEFWTLEEVGGIKMSEVPLFVITSENTFSGAEEFSYNMQTQKRATLVGQTTGGGANPGRSMRINENLSVFIPTGRAINPITNTSWEGVGVIPEIEVSVEESFDKTHKLAIEAAKEYRSKRKELFNKLFIELNDELEYFIIGTSEDKVLDKLKSCLSAEVLDEGEINLLGYDYLMQKNEIEVAQAIFRANTILHPNSANVHDSYAEALMMQGNYKASLTNYQKAVELAIQNEDRDLELFKENLAKLESKIIKDK